ncbi:hypothetical protein [Candidatus Laterigemmans baculatus]|uniref:hypothetical protein n=1 Tax=Candidatus Laterigemmans baculatus TaxID=2770505 RepID=UPI0013D94FE8|nr:hypothetical protein [Candidatus Laterigemmans baculatus]
MAQINPYEPGAAPSPDRKSGSGSRQHSASVTTEAWRGAKFGAKLSAWIFGGIGVLVALAMLGIFAYGVAVSNGKALASIDFFEVDKGIGRAIFGIALMSFYGGVTGAIVMAIAAMVRKMMVRSARVDPTR